MGRDRLKYELVARGLAESLADDVIVEGLEGMDDEMLARRALKLTGRNRERLPRQRTVILLRQRGFGEDTIERIISDCPGKD
jgi:regulatory protein